MSLLCQFVIGVTVRFDGVIKLFVSHESVDKLVVGMKETAQPLFAFNLVNLNTMLAV